MPDNQKRLESVAQILSGLVRIGKVTDVNHRRHKARVRFDGENITSGWLSVLNGRYVEINDAVLVLYLPLFNADGFILGVVN